MRVETGPEELSISWGDPGGHGSESDHPVGMDKLFDPFLGEGFHLAGILSQERILFIDTGFVKENPFAHLQATSQYVGIKSKGFETKSWAPASRPSPIADFSFLPVSRIT